MAKTPAIVGVWDHWGWAVLVTVGRDGVVVDRRRVTLIDDGLPAFPHHQEGQTLSPQAGVALVKRVRASVQRCARAVLGTLAGEVTVPVSGIAIRACPELPPTIAERITNYRAHNVADSVMYRQALADAGQARGWSVRWYEPKRVFDEAARALGRDSVGDLLRDTGKVLGRPWQKDHQFAMAAALAAARGKRPR
jgi:hypothetical protein